MKIFCITLVIAVTLLSGCGINNTVIVDPPPPGIRVTAVDNTSNTLPISDSRFQCRVGDNITLVIKWVGTFNNDPPDPQATTTVVVKSGPEDVLLPQNGFDFLAYKAGIVTLTITCQSEFLGQSWYGEITIEVTNVTR